MYFNAFIVKLSCIQNELMINIPTCSGTMFQCHTAMIAHCLICDYWISLSVCVSVSIINITMLPYFVDNHMRGCM